MHMDGQDEVRKNLITATAASSLIACAIMGKCFASALPVLHCF